MNFSPAWEAEHQRREWGRWPSEAVVRFVMRTFGHRHPRREIRFLDLGCGAGAISHFLRKEGFDVRAIDGSGAAVKRCNEALDHDELGGPMFGAYVGNVTELPWLKPCFDCVIDAACLQCLDDANLKVALSEAARVLKPAGRLFSRHSSAHGWPGVHTVGNVYPRRASEIATMYGKAFECDYMHDAYERIHPSDPARKVTVAHWNIEGTKR